MMYAERSALLTDLYQLTMLQGYFEQDMQETAVFEFFVRDMPQRNFLVAAGLEQVLDALDTMRFQKEELAWLRESGFFSAAFIDFLAGLHFAGDVHAMPEGSLFFPNEPILRVTAPIAQAQLVETRLINLLHYQTLIASKAARCVLAAPDKLLVDFGLRRAHGAEAGLLAARATYLTGFAGSSTVLAGARFGIPVYGTMAHSFVQAHESESLAFEHFAAAQPNNVVLLIDTYDTERGAEKVVELAPALAARGIAVKAVRLDSGDLAAHARRVRAILDAGGLRTVRIFSSGNLDEFALQRLLQAGAPIDGFGVGTRLDTASDVPYLDCAYKLVEYAGRPRYKKSEGKVLLPGAKQVYRRYGSDGAMLGDSVTTTGAVAEGEPLLQCVMRNGQRTAPAERLDAVRDRVRMELERLPCRWHGLQVTDPYPVSISDALRRLAAEVDARQAP